VRAWSRVAVHFVPSRHRDQLHALLKADLGVVKAAVEAQQRRGFAERRVDGRQRRGVEFADGLAADRPEVGHGAGEVARDAERVGRQRADVALNYAIELPISQAGGLVSGLCDDADDGYAGEILGFEVTLRKDGLQLSHVVASCVRRVLSGELDAVAASACNWHEHGREETLIEGVVDEVKGLTLARAWYWRAAAVDLLPLRQDGNRAL